MEDAPGRERRSSDPVLLAVTPPRTGERTLLGVENLLGSIAVPEPFSLEMAGDVDGVTLMARCIDGEVVRGQVAVRYPQARIVEVPAEDDPLRVREGEQAWAMTLRAAGPEYVPLRTFRDDDLLDPGSDPLMAIIGALSSLNEGERIVSRLLLRSLGPDWAEVHQTRVHGSQPRAPRGDQQTEQAGTPGGRGSEDGGAGLGRPGRDEGLFLGARWRDLEGGAARPRCCVRPGRRRLGLGPVERFARPGVRSAPGQGEGLYGWLSTPRSR